MDNVKEKLIKALLALPNAKYRSGNSEIEVNCCRCEREHQGNHGHLYIGIFTENSLPIHCFKCGFSGLLSPQILQELGIENFEFGEYLAKINTNSKKFYIKTSADNIKEYKIPTMIDDNNTFKIDYVVDRTGIDFFNKINIRRYKLITDLNTFLDINKLNLDRNEFPARILTKYYIGFLSYNNNTINLRKVKGSDNLPRYVNLKIDKTVDSPFLYIPPVEIDLLTINPTIVIAEGVYDILCIKERYYPEDTHNTIFAAVGTKAGYRKGLLKLLNLTCYFGATIIIFSDSDVHLDEYHKMFDSIKNSFSFKINYRVDKHKKDFGYIKDEIEGLKTYKL